MPIAHNTLEAVIRRLEDARKRQEKREWVAVGGVVAMFVVGAVTLIAGVVTGNNVGFVSGAVVSGLMSYPLKKFWENYHGGRKLDEALSLLLLIKDDDVIPKKVIELFDALAKRV